MIQGLTRNHVISECVSKGQIVGGTPDWNRPRPDADREDVATESMLDIIFSYVEDVLTGRTAPDNTFEWSLLDMIHSVLGNY